MRAALYCRSSKDRSDVSIAAQRRELEKLAGSRSLQIVRSYEDAVESGSTDDRPAFSELVRAIKHQDRGWDVLLVYDTSRLARRRYIAQAIKHQAKKHGVAIFYARMPADLDPVAELVLESVFEAMDEAHSLMSREKGLAGMAENVRQGWRAGGRAPTGYSLGVHATGAMREGKPVTKTRLVPSEEAPAVTHYLRDRARGVPRVVAGRVMAMIPSSLIGIEWNALTYAGHTVWRRHAETGTGRKRRPRAEWLITRDTHPALISEAEAESILTQLETSDVGAAVSRAKASRSSYLLTGLLFTPDGVPWVGHGKYYRLKRSDERRGRMVPAAEIDAAVLDQVRADMGSDLLLHSLLAAAQSVRAAPAADLEVRIAELEREKARAATFAMKADLADTFLPLVAERSRQIDALRREAAAVQADTSVSAEISKLTVPRLRELLADQEPARAVETLVERITLAPDLTCRLHYRAVPGSSGWRSVASPKVFDSWTPDRTRRIALRGAA
jgi:site-specific DNA recombinase